MKARLLGQNKDSEKSSVPQSPSGINYFHAIRIARLDINKSTKQPMVNRNFKVRVKKSSSLKVFYNIAHQENKLIASDDRRNDCSEKQPCSLFNNNDESMNQIVEDDGL